MKMLIGGSPCIHWSIAQTKNRETEASGIGWELFLNYRIARDKYQPDSFLYENNKSMSPAIRAQITAELGVEPVLINSALVSAQNRQRLYWAGKRNQDGTYSQVAVEQPVDRGILLRDILESGVCWKEKGYALLSTTGGTTVGGTATGHQRNGAAEPVRIGEIESAAAETRFDTSKQYKVYSPDGKATALCGNGGGAGAKTGLYAVPVPEPVNETVDGKAQCLRATYYKDGIRNLVGITVDRKTCVAIPVPAAGRIVGRRINEQGHRDDYNEEIERIQRFEVNEDPSKNKLPVNRGKRRYDRRPRPRRRHAVQGRRTGHQPKPPHLQHGRQERFLAGKAERRRGRRCGHRPVCRARYPGRERAVCN